MATAQILTSSANKHGSAALTQAPAPRDASFPGNHSARQPLFWAALAFSGGCILAHYTWRPIAWWVTAALVFAVSGGYLLHRRPRSARLLALSTFFFAGAFATGVGAGRPDTSAIWLGSGQPVTVIAHVLEEGNLEDAGAGSERQSVDLETEQISSETDVRNLQFGVRLRIYSKRTDLYDEGQTTTAPSDDSTRLTGSSEMPLLRYGQRIRFVATLNAPRNYRNPGAFDFAGYLRDQGIMANASTKYSELELLPGFIGSHSAYWVSRIHRSIIGRIHRLCPEEQAGMIDAMLVGEKSFIERSMRVDFQRSGTYHMLIVAGLHVGILAGFVLLSLRRLGWGEIPASMVTLAVILGYAVLTGEGTPVWRATAMFAVYLATRILYRTRAVLNGLGAAALALLVIKPDSLFTASFRMSFLCVALIAGIAVPALERTVELYARGLRALDALAYDRSLPPRIAQFRIDLRMILKRLEAVVPRWISRFVMIGLLRCVFWAADLFVLSAVMQIGMALPMAYYFHRATSVGIPANLLAVPLLQVLIPAAVLSVGLSYIWSPLAKFFAAIAGLSLHWIVGTVRSLGGLRFADVRLATPEASVVILCILTIAACITCIRLRKSLALAGAAALLASTMWIWTIPPREQMHPGTLEITAIDVGQGDSLLLVLPEGRKVLIDGGGLPFWMHSQMDIGEDVVSPYLWERGISRLDAVALTHAHADHSGGLPAIIANFHPAELWLPQTVPPEEVAWLVRIAQTYGVKVIYRQAGDVISLAGATIRVLAPDPQVPIRSGKRNDESLIMKVTYGQTSALLEADAEKGTERLVSSEDAAADLLKVAHHGSASATNYDFLQVVRPKFAVISVGARNVYHHPRPDVLRRLQEAGVRTYRTDRNGATTFLFDGNSVKPEPYSP